MIFHLENKTMMRHIRHIAFYLLFFFCANSIAQNIPPRPDPPKLVNDLAEMLTESEELNLERKLRDFSDRTSTQIVILTVKSLQGYDKAMFAYEIGEEWGVGQKGSDNGIVILVKNKLADSRGEVFIAPGYGLEAVIPDATAKRIVENEILPAFKQGKYFSGLDKAVNTLISLSLEEFSAEEYNKKTGNDGENIFAPLLFIIIFFIIISRLFGGARRVRRRSLGRSVPFWIALSMLGSSSRHSGSFGNFSSGGGSFGGFGGGSFGGGGAGGSW